MSRTFYSRADARTPPAGRDPIFTAKNDFITRNGLVGFVPELPVQLVKTGEPFWAPK